MNVKKARAYMNDKLQDESLRETYRAVIAMLIYDDQVAGVEGRSNEAPTNLSTNEGCSSIADRIIDLIFK